MGGLDMNKINVAIADDNQRTVEMMTELLEQESDIEVIASADNGEDALRIIKERQPDVVLLDIIMQSLMELGYWNICGMKISVKDQSLLWFLQWARKMSVKKLWI